MGSGGGGPQISSSPQWFIIPHILKIPQLVPHSQGKPQNCFKYINSVLLINYYPWWVIIKCRARGIFSTKYLTVCMHEVGSRNKQSLKTWNRLNCPECPASSDSIFIRVTVLKHDFWLINICTASIILIRYFYTQIKPNTSLSLLPVRHIRVLKHVFCAFFVLKIINPR